MPLVTVHYVDYLRVGRRDQPQAEAIQETRSHTVAEGHDLQLDKLLISQTHFFGRELLFWWVQNGTSRFITIPTPDFLAGSDDIVLKLYCMPVPVDDRRPMGAYIDAYDLDTGLFLDGPFVDVLEQPGLTPIANIRGLVKGRVDVQARAQIAAGNGQRPFREWFMCLPPVSVKGDVLRTWGVMRALAMGVYGPPKPSVDLLNAEEMLTIIKAIGGVFQGGGGIVIKPGGGADPIDPLGPMLARLEPATKQAVMAVLTDALARASADPAERRRLAAAAGRQLRAALRG